MKQPALCRNILLTLLNLLLLLAMNVGAAQAQPSDADYEKCVKDCKDRALAAYGARCDALLEIPGMNESDPRWQAAYADFKKACEKCAEDCRNPPRDVPAQPLEFSCAAKQRAKIYPDGGIACRHDCLPGTKCSVANYWFWPLWDYWQCECVPLETPLKPLPSAVSTGGLSRRPSLQEEENFRLRNKEIVSGPYQCGDLSDTDRLSPVE